MTKERMQQIMREKHSYIAYEEKDLDDFLNMKWKGNESEDTMAWYFVDYLVSQGLAEVDE